MFQITKNDFNTFDYIFGMDNDNIRALESMAPKGSKAVVGLLGAHDPEKELIIRDPYYVSFQTSYQVLIPLGIVKH